MSYYDFKKTLADTPFVVVIQPRESGKTIAHRKRLKDFMDKKLDYKGYITKIELDEFVMKNKFYTKCSRRRITKCLKCASSQK